MKLQELCLKAKPQTKYFEGGYVAFSTINGDLHFDIFKVSKFGSYNLYGGVVSDKEQYDKLMNIKTWSEVIQA